MRSQLIRLDVYAATATLLATNMAWLYVNSISEIRILVVLSLRGGLSVEIILKGKI